MSTTKEHLADVPAAFVVFKQKNGQYRWVLKSSNAFEDRDTEVVSTRALNRDVQRTDKTGEYGPLRWWHVGKPEWRNPLDWRSVVAGKGLDIGDCDFSAMEGPVLIESGTFRSPELGAAIVLKADTFRASLGFSHPLDEPDQDGVFHHINRFERSLTPANKASNMRTGLVVTKEHIMDPAKLAAFKEAVGEDIADKVLADAQNTTKEARAAGIREKGVEPAIDDLAAQLELMTSQLATFKAKVEGARTTATNVPVDDPKAVVPSAIVTKDDEPDGDEVEEDAEPGNDLYIGDMTVPEFTTMLDGAMAKHFDTVHKSLDLHGKLAAANDSMKDMKSYLGGMAQKDATVAELKDQMALLATSFKEAQDMLTDLTGDVPKELNRPRGASYKASEGIDNIVPPDHAMYQPMDDQPAAQSPLSWIDSFVVHQQQAPAQSAAVVQNGQVR